MAAALDGASSEAERESLRRDLEWELIASLESAPPAPLPGVRQVLDHLPADLPLAVASNGPREFVNRSLAAAGLGDAFHSVVGAEDVAAEKPSPDVYLEACRRLGAEPRQSVALEDSAAGVAAARRAGMSVVAVSRAPNAGSSADLVVLSLAARELLAFIRTGLHQTDHAPLD